MTETLVLLALVIALAIIFDFINGFHDAANAIATSVSTRVLAPHTAVLMAAAFNLIGAFTSTAVAKFVAKGLVDPSGISEVINQVIVLSGLLSAIIWDLITWYFGLPTSSSHAILAGIVGSAMAVGGFGAVIWDGIAKILMALVLSPVVGFLAAFLFITLLYWIFHKTRPARVSGIFKNLQIFSAMYMALSHGSNDAQKTMGIMTMALIGAQVLPADAHVPWWVILSAATAMGLGTSVGGWRIVKTLGLGLTQLRPIHGFAAEATAATVIIANSSLGLPISTTHVISSAVMGVGASKRLSAVRWGVGRRIVLAWILTLPACALLAWGICKLLLLFFKES
ncbi:inorganic phosphate transporter [Candidatus Acetothermia bacterium]|nr:inorganic phosphate transporter [Candidatus Acetothermia bacterium]